MLTADSLTLVLHDDTTTDLPTGTRYELSRGGGHYITPDGDEGTWSAHAVLRVDTSRNARRDDERRPAG